MKRYFIPIVTILVLILGVIGCSQKPEQVQELSPKDALTPKVIEKDVEVKAGYIAGTTDWLPFYLKVGDRVEGEVSITYDKGNHKSGVISQVRDPYGNVVVQTSHILSTGELWENSGFPWKFAFIAYTDGEYELGAFSSHGVDLVLAHLKITIYESD